MKEINSTFRTNLMHAIKYTDSRPNEPKYINRFLPLIHQYIQNLKKENPDLTVEELKEIIDSDIFDLSKTVYVGCTAPDAYIEYACSLYLERNPNDLSQLLSWIEANGVETENEAFYSHHNFEQDLVEYLLILKKDFPNILENFAKDAFDEELEKIIHSPTLSTQEKSKKATAYIKREILPFYQKNCMLAVNTHLYGIRTYIPEDRKIQEKNLKATLVRYISEMTSQLNKFGLLTQYNATHTSQMRRMDLKDLNYTEEDLQKLLNPNYIMQLQIDELLALSVFWLNRYSKELDTYSETMFAIREFDLLPQMLASDDVDSISIPEDYLRDMLLKMNTLYYPCEAYFQERQAEYDNLAEEPEVSQEEEEGNYILFSYDPLIEDVKKRFGKEYSEYFSQGAYKSQYTLEEDLRFYSKMQNPIYSAKTTKDEFLTAMLISLEMNPDLVNGGVIIDPGLTGRNVLSQRFAGLAIDYNLTAPVRLHIRLDVLRDFLATYQKDTKIQIYEGNEDFKDSYDRILTNSMILPFDKKMEKKLKSYTKKGVPLSSLNKKYIHHMEFLRDPKHVPEHLKTTVLNEKGKEEKVFQKRYLDLSDGKIYQFRNGSYVPFSPEERTMESDEKGVGFDHDSK